jgi:hypothetical protein
VLLASIGLTIFVVGSARAAGDTTPPTGSIDLNQGNAYASQVWIEVAVTATDDTSGIAKVELSNDGATWTDVGLDPVVQWQLPTGANQTLLPGTHTVHARFWDGAGNHAEATDQVTADTVGPTGTVTLTHWDPTSREATFAIQASDPAGMGEILVWCNSQGPKSLPFATSITVVLDGTFGPECEGYGTFSVIVQLLDTVGNVTLFQDGVTVPYETTVEYPRAAVTGSLFTIRPVFPADVVIDPSAVCRTELRWGSDAALFQNESDDTFGGMLFEGPASAGYCGEWTFTLPWVPRPKFNWTFSSPYGSFNEVFTAKVGT